MWLSAVGQEGIQSKQVLIDTVIANNGDRLAEEYSYSLVPLQVREELELKNIANEYLSELIREECWDSMEAPGKSLKVKPPE